MSASRESARTLDVPLAMIGIFVLTLCLLIAEASRLGGSIDRRVLDGMAPGAAAWWSLPMAVHVGAAISLSIALLILARRYLRRTPPPSSRAGRILLGVLLLLGLYLCLLQFDEMGNVVKQNTDFGTIHKAATALRDGGDPYAATGNGYFYPPVLAMLFLPLTMLPAPGASLLFFTVKMVMVIWSIAACGRLSGGWNEPGQRTVLFLFGAIFVSARFWMSDLEYGNTNVVIMALAIAAIDLDRRGRQVPAGLALAVAVSIKMVPGFLALHFLMRGRWKLLASGAAALVLLNLGPFLFASTTWSHAWSAYFDAGVAGKLGDRLAQPDNQSLWGMLNRAFPTVPLETLRLVWGGLAIALLGAAGGVSWRTRDDAGLAAVSAAAVYPLLGLLISPGSWVVHYTSVMLPMILLWRLALDRTWSGPAPWVLLGIAHLAFTVSGWARATVAPSIEQSWFVITALLVAVGLGLWAASGIGKRASARESS